jgi:hypothetical protein
VINVGVLSRPNRRNNSGDILLPAGEGSYTITGFNATSTLAVTMPLDTGSYTITGADVTFVRAVTPCFTANVLDLISANPKAAYSSRKLRAAYGGSALQVWRASDGHTQDIGFGADCSLDTTALLAFCAGTNCNISKWYDQSGNVNDLSAFAGTSNGQSIVVGGSLAATIGGRVANAPGSTYLRSGTGNLIGTTQGAVFVVANATSGGATVATASWWAVPAVVGMASSDNNGLALNFGFGQTGSNWNPPSFIPDRYVGDWLGAHTDMNCPVTYTFGTDAIFAFRWSTSDGTPTKGYVNGGTPVTDSNTTANAASVDLRVGTSGSSAGANFIGNIGEVLVFNVEPSLSDSNILGANQHTYWGAPWTTITL